MGKSLYLISFANSLCCLLLVLYQIPPFLEAADYVTVYRSEFVFFSTKITNENFIFMKLTNGNVYDFVF